MNADGTVRRIRKVNRVVRPTPMSVKPRAPRKPRAPSGAVSGRGFYKGFGADVGTVVGGLVSRYTGIPGLGDVGRRIGARAAQATGFGSYNIQKNSLIMPDPPEVHNQRSKEGAMIVSHREYLTDVNGSLAFNIQGTYDLNPGLSDSFPWLSQIANAFEEWEPMGILVEFVTTSGNAISSTNPALGEIILSTQYNSYAPPFTNKQQMLNQIFAVSSVPSQNVIHPVECKPSQNQVSRFYCRNSSAIGDTRLYDLGRLSVATSGQQAVNAIGELWITYQIGFYKPRLLSPGQSLSFTQVHYAFTYVAQDDPVFGTTGDSVKLISTADPFGLTFSTDRLTVSCPANQGSSFEATIILNGIATNVPPAYGPSYSSPSYLSGLNCTVLPAGSNNNGIPDTRGLSCTQVASTSGPCNCLWSYVVNVTDPTLPWALTFSPTNTVSGFSHLPPQCGGDLYVAKLS